MDTSHESVATAPMSEEKDMPDIEKGYSNSGNEGSDNEKSDERANLRYTAQDWDGPDDPGNPLNWSPWKRHYHIVPIAIISFSAYVHSSYHPMAF